MILSEKNWTETHCSYLTVEHAGTQANSGYRKSGYCESQREEVLERSVMGFWDTGNILLLDQVLATQSSSLYKIH